MSIIVELEVDIEKKYIELIKKVVIASLEYENCPYETEVSITITDNENIQIINREFRAKDKPTDVLSFPMIEFDQPSNFDVIDESDDELFNLDTGELLLGDIVISLEKAIKQSNEYGHSLERELGFLTAHSMLHLFGYDHMNEAEESIMKEKQEEILKEVGLMR